ncbi:hypothetical protein SAMN04244553_0531 [Nocardia amikacinitolerans]|uniref:DUF5671 domain-containing protein n=1 Tax=Nocardia amikacinitolerans TaxID=756689 RepID=A0A285KSN2_9NOCA|nr:hypothetical protein [Nocardia amikacinitolerans]SNY75654.1 hypothetical protein SAMN04244553_0531 [Nocardia amikacinitolerans]
MHRCSAARDRRGQLRGPGHRRTADVVDAGDDGGLARADVAPGFGFAHADGAASEHRASRRSADIDGFHGRSALDPQPDAARGPDHTQGADDHFGRNDFHADPHGNPVSSPIDARAVALLPLLGAIASQVAFVTAVLYYFGWAYSRAFFGHFGVPAGTLEFSTQDYVLFSVGAMFLPLLATLFGILALLAVRGVPAWHALRSGRPRTILRRWVLVFTAAGMLLAAVVAVLAFVPTRFAGPLAVEAPFLLIAGAAMIGYASWLRWRYPTVLGVRRPSRTVMQVRTIALVAVAMIGYVWAVAAFAERKGHDDAAHQEAVRFVDRPAIVVFSVDRLGIEGSGAQVGELTEPNGKYRYAYSGLWLLARASDRYYLLPQQWQAKRDRVFVIEDSESVRIDIARNP